MDEIEKASISVNVHGQAIALYVCGRKLTNLNNMAECYCSTMYIHRNRCFFDFIHIFTSYICGVEAFPWGRGPPHEKPRHLHNCFPYLFKQGCIYVCLTMQIIDQIYVCGRKLATLDNMDDLLNDMHCSAYINTTLFRNLWKTIVQMWG